MGVGASGIDSGRWREFCRLTRYLSAEKDALYSSALKKVLHCVFMQ